MSEERVTFEIEVNGESVDIPRRERIAVADLLDFLEVTKADGTAVAVNGSVVPRSQWPTSGVEPGDEVEIIRATQGG